MIRTVVACLIAMATSACMVVNIDETTVFEPVAFDPALAQQSGQTMLGEVAFARRRTGRRHGRAAPGPMRASRSSLRPSSPRRWSMAALARARAGSPTR